MQEKSKEQFCNNKSYSIEEKKQAYFTHLWKYNAKKPFLKQYLIYIDLFEKKPMDKKISSNH